MGEPQVVAGPAAAAGSWFRSFIPGWPGARAALPAPAAAPAPQARVAMRLHLRPARVRYRLAS
jgi:hypothetical protein